jgi:hypothetical protein
LWQLSRSNLEEPEALTSLSSSSRVELFGSPRLQIHRGNASKFFYNRIDASKRPEIIKYIFPEAAATPEL